MSATMEKKSVIQITDVRKNPKGGSCVASFKIFYKFSGHEFVLPGEFRWFEKGVNTWVGFPQRKISDDKYEQDGGFRDSSVQRRFLEQVKESFQAYMKTNPNLDVEPVVTEIDDIMF